MKSMYRKHRYISYCLPDLRMSSSVGRKPGSASRSAESRKYGAESPRSTSSAARARTGRSHFMFFYGSAHLLDDSIAGRYREQALGWKLLGWLLPPDVMIWWWHDNTIMMTKWQLVMTICQVQLGGWKLLGWFDLSSLSNAGACALIWWWQYDNMMTLWSQYGDNFMRSFYLSSLSNPGACPSQPGVKHRHLRGGEQQLEIYFVQEVWQIWSSVPDKNKRVFSLTAIESRQLERQVETAAWWENI